MNPRVLKFGGMALRDGSAVRRALALVASCGGERPVLVVSAHGETTGMLRRAAHAAASGEAYSEPLRAVRLAHRGLLAQLGLDPETCDRYLALFTHIAEAIAARRQLVRRDLDAALSLGERMSARIVARALVAAGVDATPVDAWDLGLAYDSGSSLAGSAQVRARLDELEGVPVVTGFVAKDSHGNLTTLGPDGSDLSAAVLAEALGAEELQLWKTVGGVSSADPSLVPEAHVLSALRYDEAATLARLGARVLHANTIEPVERARIPVRVRDVDNPGAMGTGIDAEGAGGLRRLPFALVAVEPAEQDVARIQLVGGNAARLASDATRLLAAEGVEVLDVAQTHAPVPLLDLGLAGRQRVAALRILHAAFVPAEVVLRR